MNATNTETIAWTFSFFFKDQITLQVIKTKQKNLGAYFWRNVIFIFSPTNESIQFNFMNMDLKFEGGSKDIYILSPFNFILIRKFQKGQGAMARLSFTSQD